MFGHFNFYERADARKWFFLALLFGCLFLVLTAFYASGVINRVTLEVERWLIGRPLTQFDCVLVQWRNFGAASINLIFIAIVGIVCGLTRYRWRVLPYLLLLILISIAIEEIGKKLFSLPVSLTIHSGMAALACPQDEQTRLQHLKLGLGMWWIAPIPPPGLQDWAHTVSQLPINTVLDRLIPSHSYPSGHAIRWWFSGSANRLATLETYQIKHCALATCGINPQSMFFWRGNTVLCWCAFFDRHSCRVSPWNFSCLLCYRVVDIE